MGIASPRLTLGFEPEMEEQLVEIFFPVLSNADSIWLTVAVGDTSRKRAKAPATWGAAIEVPSQVAYLLLPVEIAEEMELPGAKTSWMTVW